MAKKKPIESIGIEEMGIEIGGPRASLQSHSSPPEKPPGQKFEGAGSIEIVVGKLRDEGNSVRLCFYPCHCPYETLELNYVVIKDSGFRGF